MKKIISLALIFGCSIALMACGKKEDNGVVENGNNEIVEEVTPEEMNQNTNVELITVVDAVKAAYGDDYVPNMMVEGELLESTYGLTEDMYEEVYVEVPMISANIDTLIAVKVADGRQQDVVDALTSYRDYLVNDALQYPMNQLKLQSSRVIEKDGFVFFVSLGVIPMELEEENDIIDKAAELNDIAENAINSVLK